MLFLKESQSTKDTWKWADGGWPRSRCDADAAQCPRLFEKARFWQRVSKSSKSLFCKVWPFQRTRSPTRTRVQGAAYHLKSFRSSEQFQIKFLSQLERHDQSLCFSLYFQCSGLAGNRPRLISCLLKFLLLICVIVYPPLFLRTVSGFCWCGRGCSCFEGCSLVACGGIFWAASLHKVHYHILWFQFNREFDS